MNSIKWAIFIVLSLVTLAYIHQFDEATQFIVGCFFCLAYGLYALAKVVEKNNEKTLEMLKKIQESLDRIKQTDD